MLLWLCGQHQPASVPAFLALRSVSATFDVSSTLPQPPASFRSLCVGELTAVSSAKVHVSRRFPLHYLLHETAT
ncbi:hypothetical protein BD309DRAFT_334619 [Dichomitus squalens]|nr:hypothetical protein BD309DRAFT_334619 [Dichomitus squalens]